MLVECPPEHFDCWAKLVGAYNALTGEVMESGLSPASSLSASGEPFRWDPDCRAQFSSEFVALFFRLYGIDDRADVDYVLQTLSYRRSRPRPAA